MYWSNWQLVQLTTVNSLKPHKVVNRETESNSQLLDLIQARIIIT